MRRRQKIILGAILCLSVCMIIIGFQNKQHLYHSMGVILAPNRGCCCNNYGLHHRIQVSPGPQSPKSAEEKIGGEILDRTSSTATGQILQQEGNRRRIRV